MLVIAATSHACTASQKQANQRYVQHIVQTNMKYDISLHVFARAELKLLIPRTLWSVWHAVRCLLGFLSFIIFIVIPGTTSASFQTILRDPVIVRNSLSQSPSAVASTLERAKSCSNNKEHLKLFSSRVMAWNMWKCENNGIVKICVLTQYGPIPCLWLTKTQAYHTFHVKLGEPYVHMH